MTLNLGLRSEHERIPNFGARRRQDADRFRIWRQAGAPSGLHLRPGRRSAMEALWLVWQVLRRHEVRAAARIVRRRQVGGLLLHVGLPQLAVELDVELRAPGPTRSPNDPGARPARSSKRSIGGSTRLKSLDEGVDPNLKPMEEDEYQLGVEHDLGGNFVLGARYVRKDLVRTIEDVGILIPGIGEVFYIANPGEGISLTLADPGVPNFPKAEREYQGIELTAERRFSNNWSLFAQLHLQPSVRQLLRPGQLRRERPHVAERESLLRSHREHVRSQRRPGVRPSRHRSAAPVQGSVPLSVQLEHDPRGEPVHRQRHSDLGGGQHRASRSRSSRTAAATSGAPTSWPRPTWRCTRTSGSRTPASRSASRSSTCSTRTR